MGYRYHHHWADWAARDCQGTPGSIMDSRAEKWIGNARGRLGKPGCAGRDVTHVKNNRNNHCRVVNVRRTHRAVGFQQAGSEASIKVPEAIPVLSWRALLQVRKYKLSNS